MRSHFKYTYAIIGCGAFPLMLRMNLWDTGIESHYSKYILPFFVGGVSGFLVGYMQDKWVDLCRRQETIIAERTADLQKALDEVRTLKGIIPICAGCKKIRDDQGYWEQIEIYITEHSDAEFSHGLCPDCLEKFYAEEIE